ncbi:hypothetical protein EMIHUDRAFT_433331 [Emiliania huxleyi CCMP1516]|uniref:LysM domain-containing protein n=2 Tax=Emiliania huxleyi TaxID=2903 RepID=A0A0D3L019_EMIH1|nr:hypothetical protein EMIHUDRAFT_433331 [Emiliania huxleyi CCMP1516]EOD41354.1 hypothetical protein EMIHUDRAFT_433331 [Emiliania huxleyi CCMP1516]|mmetsp:Transcript_31361/g.93804  ORF Transcript_31361/g.93804 Transcript_31361/m.93804 type:complete len:225 (+) Transcript_31361:57-731(+)|eukprot:XP_005793783.1 hypothetical protein EMIHUDRAFT_433331 [Emiliania huxleyi CCMP1516]
MLAVVLPEMSAAAAAQRELLCAAAAAGLLLFGVAISVLLCMRCCAQVEEGAYAFGCCCVKVEGHFDGKALGCCCVSFLPPRVRGYDSRNARPYDKFFPQGEGGGGELGEEEGGKLDGVGLLGRGVGGGGLGGGSARGLPPGNGLAVDLASRAFDSVAAWVKGSVDAIRGSARPAAGVDEEVVAPTRTTHPPSLEYVETVRRKVNGDGVSPWLARANGVPQKTLV